ncbi:hypothetical protein [Frankia nepalensis]|nr:hypothetical protein [Frankia nepalensis]
MAGAGRLTAQRQEGLGLTGKIVIIAGASRELAEIEKVGGFSS